MCVSIIMVKLRRIYLSSPNAWVFIVISGLIIALCASCVVGTSSFVPQVVRSTVRVGNESGVHINRLALKMILSRCNRNQLDVLLGGPQTISTHGAGATNAIYWECGLAIGFDSQGRVDTFDFVEPVW